MVEPYMAQINAIGFSWAPRGWALCDNNDGKGFSISSNAGVYALVGTMYGGDGRATFGIPDLRGRVPLGWDVRAAHSPYFIGKIGGAESVKLTIAELPKHNHGIAENKNVQASSASKLTSSMVESDGIPVSTAPGTSKSPLNNSPALSPEINFTTHNIYGPSTQFATMPGGTSSITEATIETTTSVTVGSTVTQEMGLGNAFSTMPPFQVVNYVFCLIGTFPARN